MMRRPVIEGDMDSARLRRLLQPIVGSQRSDFAGLLSSPCRKQFQRLLAEALGRREEPKQDMVLSLTLPSVPVRTLQSLKEVGKRAAKDAQNSVEKNAGLLLYHAAIAAAFAVTGKNISSLPIETRWPFYDDLATAFAGTAIGQVFRRAADRVDFGNGSQQ